MRCILIVSTILPAAAQIGGYSYEPPANTSGTSNQEGSDSADSVTIPIIISVGILAIIVGLVTSMAVLVKRSPKLAARVSKRFSRRSFLKQRVIAENGEVKELRAPTGKNASLASSARAPSPHRSPAPSPRGLPAKIFETPITMLDSPDWLASDVQKSPRNHPTTMPLSRGVPHLGKLQTPSHPHVVHQGAWQHSPRQALNNSRHQVQHSKETVPRHMSDLNDANSTKPSNSPRPAGRSHLPKEAASPRPNNSPRHGIANEPKNAWS